MKKWIFIFSGSLLLVIAFNNCGKVSFAEADATNSSLDTDHPDDSDLPDDIKEVFVNCQNGVKRELTTQLDFPEERMTCNWNQNGNLGLRNGFVQARHEQSVNVSLPKGAIICNVEFASQTLSMRYDDQVLLTLNNSVLMSSSRNDIVGSFQTRAGVPQYRWDDIVGIGMDVQIYDPFCLGSQEGHSSCQFPASERTGDMNLRFGSSVIQTIMAMDINRTTHTFKFITTGDDDSSDCIHNAFSIPMKVQYVIKTK